MFTVPRSARSRSRPLLALTLSLLLLAALVPPFASAQPATIPLTVDASDFQDDAWGINPPTNAVDGDLSTRWSALGDGQWLRGDLGGSYDLTEIRLAWFQGDRRTSHFSVEVSDDGETWRTAIERRTSSGDTLAPMTFPLAETASWVRVTGYGNDAAVSSQWNSITSFEVVGTPTPTPVPSVQAVIVDVAASGYQDDPVWGTHPPQHTIDGDPTTRWSVQGRAAGGDEPFIVWTFDRPYTLSTAALHFYGPTAGPGQITDFHLDVSTDGHTWQRALSSASAGNLTDDGPDVFDLHHDATHVRFVGEGRANSTWNSLVDVTFHGHALSPHPTEPAPVEQEPAPDLGSGSQPVTDGTLSPRPDAGPAPAPVPAPAPQPAPEATPEPEPEPEPAAAPEVPWATAWASEDLDTITDWFTTYAGLSDPSALAPVSTARVVSTHPGQVIENLDIRYAGGDNKAIWIRHDDVVVRNNRVYAEGDRNVIWVDGGLSGVVIEHNELDGSAQDYGTSRDDANGRNVGIATRGPVASIRRNLITGVRQGAALYPDTVVEENLVTGLHVNAPGVSTSAFGHLGGGWGYAGGTVIRRNLVEAGSSGAITVYSQGAGPARDARFEQNLVLGVGRGFGIRGGHSGENRHAMRDIRIEGNRFHGTFGFPTVLGGGTNAAVNLARPGTTFADNRWLGSDDELPARCGTSRNACE